MGSGLGRHQRAILDVLTANPQLATFESLRWALWESENSGTSIFPDLATKWDTSLKRALDSLVDKGFLKINPRRLSSLDECIEHFPQKTLSSEVRQLRKLLLRVLFEWEDSRPHYSSAENENFHLNSVSQEERAQLLNHWLEIEPRLMVILARCIQPTRNHLFQLIAKGKALFENEDLKSKSSFDELTQQFLQAGICSATLDRKIRTLNELLLDTDEGGFLRLKSVIHSVAYVPERGSDWSLKPKVVEYLESCRHSVLSNLPDYKPAARLPNHRKYRSIDGGRGAVQSPLLNKLLDHSVYTSFRFVEIG